MSIMKIDLRNEFFFGVKEFFPMNFDFKNRYKNEFKDDSEKSCRLSWNRVSHKIDYKVVWPLNGHADSLGVSDWAPIKKILKLPG